MLETPQRIEPTKLATIAEPISDAVADLSAAAAGLGKGLAPQTAVNLARLVRVMNSYYSNLIEGHNTRPRDIELALSGILESDPDKRSLQVEAAAHVRVQQQIDEMAAANTLPEPTSSDFVRWLHIEFYRGAAPTLLTVKGSDRELLMIPGEWRSMPEHDVEVGRHIPPSSHRVPDFMNYFEDKFRLEKLGAAGRLLAMAAAHHRLNYIHPFPDGNGRVSRLMSHAMAHKAGIGAHGLWSISRGLARGLKSRNDYKQMMSHADMPRQGDIDGRGNLSERALGDFTLWFLRVCVDQIDFMASLFDLNTLADRFRRYVQLQGDLRAESANLLEEALMRGHFERGAAARITGLPERTARRTVAQVIDLGLLASETPKGPLSLRFPEHSLDVLFPSLFLKT